MRGWVFGYFGHRNLGDEAILAAVLSHAPGDLSLRILTGNERNTRAAHDAPCCLAPSLDDPPESLSRWRRLFMKKYWLRYGRKLWADLRRPRPCVYACGGSISDHVLDSVVRLERRVAALKAMQCSVGLLAVGADRLTNPADRDAAVRLLTQHADYCSVRDRASYDNLIALGIPPERVRLAADVVFSLASPHRTIVDAAKPLQEGRIALNLRPLFRNRREQGDDKDRRLAEYTEACVQLAEQLRRLPAEVTLVPLSPEDVDFLRLLGQRAGLPVAPLERKPADAMQNLQPYDFLLGMRFHSIVFSSLCGLPCLAIPYAPKVLALAKELHLPGEELAIGDGTEMSDRPLNVSGIVEHLQALWPRRAELQRRQMAVVSEKRTLALQDMEACWHTLRKSSASAGEP